MWILHLAAASVGMVPNELSFIAWSKTETYADVGLEHAHILWNPKNHFHTLKCFYFLNMFFFFNMSWYI